MDPEAETSTPSRHRLLFPRWANYLVPAAILVAIGLTTYVPTLMVLGFSPQTKDVGYRPTQPVPFDHALHAGGLGMDCRYCHSTVERAAFAAVPPTQTCMNCHSSILPQSAALAPVRESFKTGRPIEWTKVHDLPDYAYFNHAAHVAKGVGCTSCHGRVDEMPQVFQAEPMSMAWCLDCHRNPEPNLRPRDQVTNMAWTASGSPNEGQGTAGSQPGGSHDVADPTFMTSCSTCHR